MARKTSQRRIVVQVQVPEHIKDSVRKRLRPFFAGPLQETKETITNLCVISGVMDEDPSTSGKLANLDRSLRDLERRVGVSSPLTVDLEVIEKQEASASCNEEQSICVGTRFIVFPKGEISTSVGDRIALPITGLHAFGDGTHPSTFLALQLVEAVLGGRFGALLPDGWILDAGCGTGILGLAASAMGGYDVLGVDISEEAIAAAKLNRRKMGTAGLKVQYVQGGFQCGKGPFFLVLANLVASVHTGAHASLWEATVPGGWLILTGFSTIQKGLVVGPYLQKGAREKASEHKKGWAGVVLKKPEENVL